LNPNDEEALQNGANGSLVGYIPYQVSALNIA